MKVLKYNRKKENKEVLLITYEQFQQVPAHAYLAISSEKLQNQPPILYLGHMLYPKEIKPQKSEIRKNSLQNLNDL